MSTEVSDTPGPARIWRAAPVTTALLAAILLVHGAVELLGGSSDGWTLLRFGGNFVGATRHGEPWRLLTSTFLHAGLLHLAVNAYALYNLGRLVEQLFGSARFLVIYFFAGLTGSLASMIVGEPGRLSVGASGAIFGLLGAALVAMVRLRGRVEESWRRQVIYNLVIVIALNVYIGFTVARVDNSAHLGGLLGGAAAAVLLLLRGLVPGGRVARALVGALATLLLLGVLGSALAAGLTAPRQTLDRLPVRQFARAGIEVIAPAHWVALETSELALQDPLLAVSPTLQFDVVAFAGEVSLEEYTRQRTAFFVQKLEELPDVSDVHPVPPTPGLAPSGVTQGEIGLRAFGEEMRQVSLARQQGDLIVAAIARIPTSRLQAYAGALQRAAETMRYDSASRRSGGLARSP